MAWRRPTTAGRPYSRATTAPWEMAEPTSVNVETFGTAKVDEDRISVLVREHFGALEALLERLEARVVEGFHREAEGREAP